MTKEQRGHLTNLKGAANSPKSALLDILRSVEEVSPAEGRRLASIIGRLEAWQNTGAGVRK